MHKRIRSNVHALAWAFSYFCAGFPKTSNWICKKSHVIFCTLPFRHGDTAGQSPHHMTPLPEPELLTILLRELLGKSRRQLARIFFGFPSLRPPSAEGSGRVDFIIAGFLIGCRFGRSGRCRQSYITLPTIMKDEMESFFLDSLFEEASPGRWRDMGMSIEYVVEATCEANMEISCSRISSLARTKIAGTG